MFESSPAQGAEAALARLDELVARAGEAAGALASAASWTGGQRAGALRRLDRLAGAFATARAAVVVADQAAGDAGLLATGDRDYAAARARSTRTGLGEARREMRQAETLHALPSVADAVGSGGMPVAHLDALARVSAGASERARAALSGDDVQAMLVRWASRQTLREFTAAVQRLVASFDPAELERSAEAQHRARFLHLSHQADGTYLKGRLDRVAGETLRVALVAANQIPGDGRTKDQAEADALVAVAERALAGMAGVRQRRATEDGALLPDPDQDAADARVSGVAGRPTVSVLVPSETFTEVCAHQRAAETGAEPLWRPVEPAAFEDGTPIAMSELARLLCDSEVGRIVLDADSVPTDLGRTTRLYSGVQRRAVVVRDRACAWNGCDVPAAFCEVHHIRWWERDLGVTSVKNGILLCRHHHRTVHSQDLRIRRLAPHRDDGGGRAPRWMLAEPTRYEFAARDGSLVNGPPGRSDASARAA